MKLQLLTATLLLAVTATAQNPTNTKTVIRDARRVTVTENDSAISLVVEGQGADSTYLYTISTAKHQTDEFIAEKSDRWDFSLLSIKRGKDSDTLSVDGKKRRWERYVYGLGLACGFVNTPGSAAAFDNKWGRSGEFYIDFIGAKFRRSRNVYGFGLGMNVRSFRLADSQLRYTKNDRKGAGYEDFPDGAGHRRSWLHTWDAYLALSYEHKLSRDWALSGRVNVNYGFRARAVSEYRLHGHRFTDEVGNIKTAPVSLDFIGQVKYDGVGFYVKYNPCHTLRCSDFGNDFHQFGLGISVGF